MSAVATLTVVEAKLLWRDRMATFFGLVFPALLLVILGVVFPGATEPSADLGGHRLVDLYAPIVIALGVASLALATLPAYLAGYRQNGVLRRLSTTPVHPGRLLSAQLAVQVGMAALAAGLTIVLGAAVFGIDLPQNPFGFVLAFLLVAASLFAIGLLIGAVVPTASAAQGLGMLVYFPMLFFSGVYFPREVMPDGLRTVSDFTPVGAGVQALQDTWVGAAPSVSNLLVMAAYAIGAGLLAAKVFRWE